MQNQRQQQRNPVTPSRPNPQAKNEPQKRMDAERMDARGANDDVRNAPESGDKKLSGPERSAKRSRK